MHFGTSFFTVDAFCFSPGFNTCPSLRIIYCSVPMWQFLSSHCFCMCSPCAASWAQSFAKVLSFPPSACCPEQQHCSCLVEGWLGYWLNHCCSCICGSLLFLYTQLSKRKPPCSYTCITVCTNQAIARNLFWSNEPSLSVGQQMHAWVFWGESNTSQRSQCS